MNTLKELLKDKDFTYGTHLPVIRAIMETFPVSGTLELGVGLKSTPVFVEYKKKHVAVESEKEWYDVVIQQIEESDRLSLYYHNIGFGIHSKTKWSKISEDIKRSCFDYYYDLMEKHSPLNFLFVDHVSGLRAFTVKEMIGKFDVILYHDAQHPGYGYDIIEKCDLSKYASLVFQSFGVYTGILIDREKYQIIECDFDDKLKEFGKQFCKNFEVEYKHCLIRKF